MIVEKHISIRRLIPIIWKRMAVMAIISAAIVVPMKLFALERFAIGIQTPLILGTALSIFLGFRTNSAYERWMAARRTFGDIGAQIRNAVLVLARRGEPYIDHSTGKPSQTAPAIMTRMIGRMIAFQHIFGRQLIDEADPLDFDTAEALLPKEEIKALRSEVNPTLHLLFLQGKDFRLATAEGQFFDGEHFELVGIQRELATLMNQAQMLKNTPFPTHYTFFTDVFVWMLVILLSLSLPANESMGLAVVPLVVLIGWVFTMVEGIGSYMDDPWMNNRNVIPVKFLAREHERELRRLALGEDFDAPSLQPVDGALY